MLELIDPPEDTSTAPPRLRTEHPSERTDRMLFARCNAGDRRARERLIERWLPLARSVARRYERSGEPLEDLVQVASLALIKAIDRYDPALGHAFTSYAVPSIMGELKRHFRDRGWVVRPPRGLQELTLRIERAATDLSARLDRVPTVAELGTAIDISDEQILEALQARTGRDALSLQASTGALGEQTALEHMLGADEDGYAQAELRAFLDDLMTGLPRRAREVLRLRFEEDLTQAEIGVMFGVSQMQISRIIRHAVHQLRGVADQHERMLGERIDRQRVPV
jgi:RNA polymerase sigma-B factor